MYFYLLYAKLNGNIIYEASFTSNNNYDLEKPDILFAQHLFSFHFICQCAPIDEFGFSFLFIYLLCYNFYKVQLQYQKKGNPFECTDIH